MLKFTGGEHTISPKNININKRARLFLLLGVLCFTAWSILLLLRASIISSIPAAKLTSLLSSFSNALWCGAVLIGLILFCAAFFWYLKTDREKIQGSQWLIYFLSFAKYSLLLFLFFYTLFPFSWTKPFYARSLDSYPDSTPFDFFTQLLFLGGTIFFCLYCFDKLPLKVAARIDKPVTKFLSLKETHFVIPLLLLCFLVTGLIAFVVLDHIPHVQDSIAQLFQAKIFKMGKLYAPLPPLKEFFDYTNIINDEKWYSQYPFGHSLLLMGGLFFKVPWLVNPFLSTCSLFVLFLLIKTIYQDRRTVYFGASLLFLSPFFLFMSSNYMNHTSTMFFILLFLYFYARLLSSQSSLQGLLSGLFLGFAINIRPLDAACISLPFIGYLLSGPLRKSRAGMKSLQCFFAGVLMMIFVLLVYNALTNGSPFIFGYMNKYNTLGFLGSAQAGIPHTLKGGIVNTSNNLVGLNDYLFEWPVPSLIFVFFFFLVPCRKNRWDSLFMMSSLMLIAGYFFYYYQDLCFGPRFYYSITPFLVIFTVRGFLELPGWLEKFSFDRRQTESCLSFLLCLCCLYAFLFSLAPLIEKYSDDYWGVTDEIHSAIETSKIKNALVFIDVWFSNPTSKPNLIPYGSGFQFNSPRLNDDVIYAMDLKEKNPELMKKFPGRNYYLCKFHKPMRGFTLKKLNTP